MEYQTHLMELVSLIPAGSIQCDDVVSLDDEAWHFIILFPSILLHHLLPLQ